MTLSVVTALLIVSLGSEDFRERERAQHALQQYVALCLEELTFCESHPDLEIAVRCKQIVERHYQQRAKRLIVQLQKKRFPWIDMLPGEHLPNFSPPVGEYLRKAQQTVKPGTGWPDYREATRLYIYDLLLSRETVAQIETLLRKMEQREIKWCKNNSHQYLPPF